MEPTFYSVSEVAEILKKHRITVYRQIASGVLKAKKVGGTWVIYPDQLAAHVGGQDRLAELLRHRGE